MQWQLLVHLELPLACFFFYRHVFDILLMLQAGGFGLLAGSVHDALSLRLSLKFTS